MAQAVGGLPVVRRRFAGGVFFAAFLTGFGVGGAWAGAGAGAVVAACACGPEATLRRSAS
jgi:hypothetical protein